MTSSLPPSLPVLRQLLNEAGEVSPVPWSADFAGEVFDAFRVPIGERISDFDAELIVALRNAAPALLDLVERQAAAIEAVQELADSWEQGMRDFGYLDGRHDGATAIRAVLEPHLSVITPTAEENPK